MSRRLLSGALALLAAALPVAAPAQVLSPQDSARGVTVESRARTDFDPMGMRLGGFRLDGRGEVGGGYDSNLFGRSSNAKSSPLASQSGLMTLNSDWSRHALGSLLSVSSRQYPQRGSIDWTDYAVGTQGRYDLGEGGRIEGRYRHSREHLDIYNVDVQGAGISKPVPYTSDDVQAALSQRFNRFSAFTAAQYRTYHFRDVMLGGTRNRMSQQSYQVAIGTLGSSYQVMPGREVVTTLRLQDTSYFDRSARGRDSITYEGTAGFIYDLDGVWQGRMNLGWRQRDYSSPQLKALAGLAADGALIWLPSYMTNVSLNVARTIEESIRANAVGYTRTTGGIRLDHELLRNIILTGDLRLDHRSYQSPTQVATDITTALGLRWLINRNMALSAGYAQTRRLRGAGGINDYIRNIADLRLAMML